jgi:pre-mRNA-splicing factor SPF27
MKTVLDSLPYYDREYDEPEVKAMVDKLIKQEQSKMKLPKAEKLVINLKNLEEEFEAMKLKIDFNLVYSIPQVNNKASVKEWQQAIDTLKIQIMYQNIRKINAQLALRFGGTTWLDYNNQVDKILQGLDGRLNYLKNQGIEINKERKIQQIKTGAQLDRLEIRYREAIDQLVQVRAGVQYVKSLIK